MDCTVSKEESALVINVSGRLDTTTSPAFSKQCAEIDTEQNPVVILQLDRLEYISSAGLREILALAKRLMSGNGRLLLCSLQPMVDEVFRIAGFSSHLEMYASLDDALGAVQ